ncbi:MAG: cytochrome c3 family protein [Bacteroidota bacterium]
MKFRVPYVFLIFVFGILFSCSPKSNFRTLSFFFDGVSDTVRATDVIKIDSSRIKDSLNRMNDMSYTNVPGYIYHPPYKKEECNACHDNSGNRSNLKPQPGMCYSCHQDFKEKFAFLHGPVSSGYCTNCHAPHMSTEPKLLKRKGQQICTTCHQGGQLMKTSAHLEIGNRECTVCHNPHGGANHFILR